MKIRGWIAQGISSGYCGHMHKSREAARRCCRGDQRVFRVYENTQEILDDPREDAALAAVVEDAISQPSQVPIVQFLIRDPFAGELEVSGATLPEAVAAAYEDVPEDERPAYVWYQGKQIPVPGGACRPVF